MLFRTLFVGMRRGRGDRPLAALLLASGLAVWLLWQPGLILGLAWPWRWSMVVLGSWALGCAFVRPLALDVGERGAWRLAGMGGSRAALPVFALLLVGRGLFG